MCAKHWRMVPRFVQNLIWHYYREGQEIDKNPSTEYICVAFVSISTVALQEGRTLPRFRTEAQRAATPVQHETKETQ
jgi:hypothetical protein